MTAKQQGNQRDRSLVGWLAAEALAIVVWEVASAIGDLFAYVLLGRRRR